MKKTITILLLIYSQFSYSQGLGIGTNPPHTSAELDVNSTIRGMLIPRMTASQRVAIVNPAAGLLVFQTDNFGGSPSSLSGLYIYETNNAIVGWKRIAKAEEIAGGGSNSWVVSGTNQSSGVTGNVGIGITNPTSKLHVVGDATLEDGELAINNSFDGIKFKDDNSTKNRIQSSGTTFDFNIGTVSGNTTGKLFLETQGSNRLTINPAGDVGIGTISPTEKLHVNGNILSSGTIKAENTLTAGAGFVALGNSILNSTSILNGDASFGSTASATFRGGMVLNKVDGTLQLKANDIDKGFVQLDGSNLRIGTNSSNNFGKFVVRTNGADHLTIDQYGNAALGVDPAGLGAKFAVFGKGRFMANGGDALESQGKLRVKQDGEAIHVDGNDPAINFFENGTQRAYLWAVNNDVNLGTSVSTGKMFLNSSQINLQTPQVNVDAKLTATTTGLSYNLLPVCYGRVDKFGNKDGGTPNFTVERYSEGIYKISSPQISASSIFIMNSTREVTTHVTCTYEYYQGLFWVHTSDESGSHRDSRFNFVIFDP